MDGQQDFGRYQCPELLRASRWTLCEFFLDAQSLIAFDNDKR